MRNKIFTIIASILIAITVASPTFAADVDWNKQKSAAMPTSKARGDVCTELFKGDPNNIFREVFCSLINIVSLSIADFSTDLTCKIQETSYRANYFASASFRLLPNSGKCETNANAITMPPSVLTANIRSGSTMNTFKIVRGTVVVLALVFFIFLAFANILHINVNTYSIKRALPMMFVALAGGFIAIYIVYILSYTADFLLGLDMFSLEQTLHPMFNIFGGYLGNPFYEDITSGVTTGPANSVNLVFEVGRILSSGTGPTFVSGIIGSILLIIPAVVVFAFEYVLAIRPFAVQILTILSPIAFASLILPQTQFLFRKWWSITLIAIFYAPVVNLVFYLLNLLPVSGEPIVIMTLWAVKIVFIIFLIRLPFTFETDLKKITERIAKTGFGGSIGLDRLAKPKAQNVKSDIGEFVGDKKLKGPQAQKIIVSNKSLAAPTPTGKTTRPPLPMMTNIKDILKEAHSANLKRTPDLMVNSASDIPSETFKAITQNSDLKVWRDRNIVSQLKNQNGQILNDAGAALRADSSRKLIRLAEVVDNERLTNPDAVKFLSQKQALDQLPLYILKKALDENVINSSDIQNTFGTNSVEVMNRLNRMSATGSSAINSSNLPKIADYDQKDFASGYKDLNTAMNEVLSNPNIKDTGAGLTKSIVTQIKNLDKGAIDQNGLYYLERLGQTTRQSQQNIVKTLQGEGISNQIATAIAQNPGANTSNLDQLLSGKQVPDNTKQALAKSFMSRDLSTSLSSQIASSLSEEKTLIQKSISGKIAENIGKGTDLKTIKTDVATALGKISSPASPEQAQKSVDKVNQYYPGAQVKVGQELSGDDLAKAKEHGASILETIENMAKGGVDENTIKNNLPAVEKRVEGQVKDTIRKVASGVISSDSVFDSSLSNITASASSKNG